MAFLLCALVADHDMCLEEMIQCVPHVLSEMVYKHLLSSTYVTVKLVVSHIFQDFVSISLSMRPCTCTFTWIFFSLWPLTATFVYRTFRCLGPPAPQLLPRTVYSENGVEPPCVQRIQEISHLCWYQITYWCNSNSRFSHWCKPYGISLIDTTPLQNQKKHIRRLNTLR